MPLCKLKVISRKLHGDFLVGLDSDLKSEAVKCQTNAQKHRPIC